MLIETETQSRSQTQRKWDLAHEKVTGGAWIQQTVQVGNGSIGERALRPCASHWTKGECVGFCEVWRVILSMSIIESRHHGGFVDRVIIQKNRDEKRTYRLNLWPKTDSKSSFLIYIICFFSNSSSFLQLSFDTLLFLRAIRSHFVATVSRAEGRGLAQLHLELQCEAPMDYSIELWVGFRENREDEGWRLQNAKALKNAEEKNLM